MWRHVSRILKPTTSQAWLPRRCLAAEQPNDSSKYDEKLRTKKEGVTQGMVRTHATVDPQVYSTSDEDNFERTTVSFPLEEESSSRKTLFVNVSEVSFELVKKNILLGPVAAFPHSIFSWRVPNVDAITEESLLLFTLLEPKPDILVIGVGNVEHVRDVELRLRPFFKKHKLRAEIIDTISACATFNILNLEGRFVAAALLPPQKLDQYSRKYFLETSDPENMQSDVFGFSKDYSENAFSLLKTSASKILSDIRKKHEHEKET